MNAKRISIISLILIVVAIGGYFLYRYITSPHLFVGGTEYGPGDNGRVFVQVLSDAFTPVNNAVCKATIYYPDNSYFYKDSPMMALGERGMYYLDFVAPDVLGVYMVSIECVYPNNETTYYPDQVYVNAGIKSGNIQNVYENDRQYLYLYPDFDGVLDAEFWFEPVSNNTKEIDIYYNGRMKKTNGDIVYMYIWNNCNDDWEKLPNAIDYYHPFVGNVADNNVSCYIDDQYNSVGIRFYSDNMNLNNELIIDMLKIVGFTPSSQYITNLRGGGEVHVKLIKGEFTLNYSQAPPSAKVIS